MLTRMPSCSFEFAGEAEIGMFLETDIQLGSTKIDS